MRTKPYDPWERVRRAPSLRTHHLADLRMLVRSTVVAEGRRDDTHPYWLAEGDLDPAKRVEMTRPKAPYTTLTVEGSVLGGGDPMPPEVEAFFFGFDPMAPVDGIKRLVGCSPDCEVTVAPAAGGIWAVRHTVSGQLPYRVGVGTYSELKRVIEEMRSWYPHTAVGWPINTLYRDAP